MEPSRPRERDLGCMRTRREVVDDEEDGSRHDLVRNGLLVFPFPFMGIVGEFAEISPMLVSPMVGMLRLWPLLRTVESVLDTSQAHFWFLLITNWAEKCLKKEKTCRIFFFEHSKPNQQDITSRSPSQFSVSSTPLFLYLYLFLRYFLK